MAIPFFFGPYRVSQFTLVLIYAVAVLGLNLLVGYSGQISLGHGAFFCLGAYTGAILLDRTSIPYLLTIPAAGLVCFAAGLALGLPALRLRGLYLALVTLAIAIATPVLIKRFDGLTGGSQGITVEQPTVAGVARARRRPVPLLPRRSWSRCRCSGSPPGSCAATSAGR